MLTTYLPWCLLRGASSLPVHAAFLPSCEGFIPQTLHSSSHLQEGAAARQPHICPKFLPTPATVSLPTFLSALFLLDLATTTTTTTITDTTTTRNRPHYSPLPRPVRETPITNPDFNPLPSRNGDLRSAPTTTLGPTPVTLPSSPATTTIPFASNCPTISNKSFSPAFQSGSHGSRGTQKGFAS